jgi:hypothetical protein
VRLKAEPLLSTGKMEAKAVVRARNDIHRILKHLEQFTRPHESELPASVDMARLHSRVFAFGLSDAIVRVRAYDTYHDGAFFNELYNLLLAQIDLIAGGVTIRAE